jgi:hypothetical protein
MSSALRFEIRLAWDRREEALDLADLIHDPPSAVNFELSPDDNPENVASRLRDLLEVDINAQTSWQSKYEALNSWRASYERLGVLVFQTGGSRTLRVDPSEARGLSTNRTLFYTCARVRPCRSQGWWHM